VLIRPEFFAAQIIEDIVVEGKKKVLLRKSVGQAKKASSKSYMEASTIVNNVHILCKVV